jgi:hypothetical protein
LTSGLLVVVGRGQLTDRAWARIEPLLLVSVGGGGGASLPNSQLAVLPGTTHITLVQRADWLLSMIAEFLDAPMPEGQ